jgi:hypothetical protein
VYVGGSDEVFTTLTVEEEEGGKVVVVPMLKTGSAMSLIKSTTFELL